MSFFTSNRSDFCPGPIVGNPLNGLCERVCIETKKVYKIVCRFLLKCYKKANACTQIFFEKNYSLYNKKAFKIKAFNWLY